jgi:RNA polymerase subunit RPABC4/transcription elongation factor Spt4
VFGSSKSGSKNIRFFCESCGAEVPRDAKECPQCGKRFASVLCPACGFAGGESLFKSGCPVCGYSQANPAAKSSGPVKFPESKKPAGPLPLWVYILTAAAFTGVLEALFFSVFK